MGAVARAVDKVADEVSDVVQSVGNVIEDAVDDVVEEILEPVVKTVDRTITAALEDPVGTAIKVAAISTGNPAIMAAANAAVAVANGADFEDAAKAAAIAYVAGEVAQGTSEYFKPEFAEAGMTASQAGQAASVAGNVVGAVASGGDPLSALISGGLNAGVNAVASEIPGWADMSATQRGTATKAITAALEGKDPTQALINAAIGAGVNAAKNSDIDYSELDVAPSTELTDQVLSEEGYTDNPFDAGPTPVTDPFVVPDGTFEPTEQDTNEFYKSIGIDPESLSDMPAQEEDPLAFLNAPGYYDEITGKFIYDENGQLQAPLDDTSGTNLDSMDGYTTKDGITTGPDGETYDLSHLTSSYTPLDTSKLAGTPKVDTSYGDAVTKFLNSQIYELKPGSTGNALLRGGAGLAALSALSDSDKGSNDPYTFQNDPYADYMVDWNAQNAGLIDGEAYGVAQLNPEFSTVPTVQAAAGGLMYLAKGGASSLGGYAAGGNPRLLRGPGDGMSDNIPATIANKQPARLADGEFVVPADVVSHLGNGSTEAGAKVLHQMMDRVRKARTGNSKQGKQIQPQKFIPRKGK